MVSCEQEGSQQQGHGFRGARPGQQFGHRQGNQPPIGVISHPPLVRSTKSGSSSHRGSEHGGRGEGRNSVCDGAGSDASRKVEKDCCDVGIARSEEGALRDCDSAGHNRDALGSSLGPGASNDREGRRRAESSSTAGNGSYDGRNPLESRTKDSLVSKLPRIRSQNVRPTMKAKPSRGVQPRGIQPRGQVNPVVPTSADMIVVAKPRKQRTAVGSVD